MCTWEECVLCYFILFHKSGLPVSSVQYSHSVVSDSLRPHELQHARLPSPLPTPRACSNSCPSVMPSNHLTLCHPPLLLPSIALTWSEGVMTLYFNFCASHSTLWHHMSLTQTQEVSGGSSLHFTGVQTQPWKDWATLSHSSGLFHRYLLRVHYVPRTSLTAWISGEQKS